MIARTILLLSIYLLNFAGASAHAQEYYGNVGKMEATFFLKWDENGAVSGEYWYPERKGLVYTLIGENREEGKLFLREFTGNERTANCNLTKRVTDTEIIWEGKMKNTDGREFDMSMKRPRVSNLPAPAMEHKVLQIPEKSVWEDFPGQDEEVETVKQGSPGGFWAVAEVSSYRGSDGWTDIGLRLKEEESNQLGSTEAGVRFSTKETTLRLRRELPIPAASMLGKNVGVFIDKKGVIEDVFLTVISITHWRKTAGGDVEIRGFLDSEQAEEIDLKSLEELRQLLPKLPMVNMIPDKLALTEYQTEEIFARTIRLNRRFGIVVQMTDAGPGILELEGISLSAPLDEIPWIYIGDQPGWNQIPLSQRVGEAG